jgi:PAS domain S-box-containing protein
VGRGAAWATGFWLFFLFLSLLALALAPVWLEREVQETRDRIRTILEPAQRLAARIQFAQSRQMESVYSFLLLGNAPSRLRYREGREVEEAALDTLGTLLEEAVPDTLVSLRQGISLGVREDMANLLSLSVSWHLNHADMLRREVSETGEARSVSDEEFRARLIVEQAAYTEVVAATSDLIDALAREMELAQSVMTRRRVRQAEYAQILVVVGLVATVVVLVLAWRLRMLIRASEARRLYALEARREADGLLGATGDGVLGMDMEGRCTFLNRAGAELLGYSARHVVGRDVHGLLHHSGPEGQPIPREECTVIGALKARKTISGQNDTLWRAGGQPFPVQVSLRPVADGTEHRGAVLSFVDMTEIRAAEASLRQAVQARDEVLAVVSHDLRNPVGVIFSAASLLLTLNPSPEKQREHLLAVKRSAGRINRLIQDLLDVARLEAGALPVQPGAFHGDRLLEEVVEGHRRNAEEKGVLLRTEVPDRVPMAWGDRHRVTQALTNLLENALRETPAGGEVTVGIEVDWDREGLRFFVSDTGPGIPPEDRERLFDRFWQVSRKDTGGAGLGLSIVKGIVEAHEGRVWVDSQPGVGSTFWFSLPGGPEATS